ncbi:hypothetical protein FOXG_17244 [Fusarium oxysporum f. sp. lycopersici 4287]|uniref:Uncharacterized protein n=1 Tax=Fusarium oxysporum f. sp. lycopersici (strain 4287 / CBS 123668 / FGSC 9935 / NRRL 34936) TaxID=426428 RepID=A0A0J9WVR2_FUSO4|nr:hypothetical protein FOXG_17244 [Fusarium oxysporum f. sp. lycopersici 4287]XP_018258023.1 hypothetical protein FOXG_17244 [Fusarium oxysporum f. sp. lycopersici 4287]EWZ78167.1 hypothetical protein FOWG_17520 [Fusarium oxysporum f. sp. lycopersici MN25]EWZ78168.1 hypothetical protein FOWG_17520 [Fusarium oxysporum f. sp. lycopersici MN25]KNB19977.1 hypothetical protein FOXG_17244 [Fusarium oxysporum f. sp. lycopersici 4287]KNB19978.1 hypothetical protein FOXG_17244 [Fusarium oxysporum f. s
MTDFGAMPWLKVLCVTGYVPWGQPGLARGLPIRGIQPSLTAEVLSLIHDVSGEIIRRHRCRELLKFVSLISQKPSPKKETHQLSSILSWKRGANTSPITIAEDSLSNYVLLIYDDRGLHSITQYCSFPKMQIRSQRKASIYWTMLQT